MSSSSGRVTFTLIQQVGKKFKDFKRSLTKKDQVTKDQLKKPISPNKDILGPDGKPTGLKTTKGMTDAINEQSRKQNRKLVEDTAAHNAKVTSNRVKVGLGGAGAAYGINKLRGRGASNNNTTQTRNVVPQRETVKTSVPKLKDTTVFVNWRDRPYSIDNSRRPGTETKRKFLPF